MPRPQNKPVEQVDDHQPVLKPEVAAEYELAEGTVMIFADNEFDLVDLSQINLELAHRLAAKGYLKKLS